MSAVHIERTAHLVPPSDVFARERHLEPVSGFEPLTVRLQGGCSAKLSYTGRLDRVRLDPESLPGYRF
jgi:hypothetical protein